MFVPFPAKFVTINKNVRDYSLLISNIQIYAIFLLPATPGSEANPTCYEIFCFLFDCGHVTGIC